jgi:hypothetical protein
MTQDEIKQMAREAVAQHGHEIRETNEILETLTSFANLVAAKEREVCAKLCEEHWRTNENAQTCADTIRARSNA